MNEKTNERTSTPSIILRKMVAGVGGKAPQRNQN